MLRLLSRNLIILTLLAGLDAGTVFAQSNFDLFFKTDGQYQDVVIGEVISADTFRLKPETGERGEIIKLIGLKSPEPPKSKTEDIKRNEFGLVIKDPVSPLTPIEEKAFAFTKELLEGKRVRLEFDVNKKGEENETLAYAFLLENGAFVNAEVLRNGYAHLSIRPPNTKYSDELRAAYKEARDEKRGLQGE